MMIKQGIVVLSGVEGRMRPALTGQFDITMKNFYIQPENCGAGFRMSC